MKLPDYEPETVDAAIIVRRALLRGDKRRRA